MQTPPGKDLAKFQTQVILLCGDSANRHTTVQPITEADL